MPSPSTTSYPKSKINILLLENINPKAVTQFEQNGYTSITKHAGALSEKDLIEAIKNVHLLGIRSKTNITPKVLQSATKLQSIGCYCIGTDQVQLPSAMKTGVAVFNAPYSNTRSVAELVIGASILLIRRILEKNQAAHAGVWLKEAVNSFELRGKTIGIVGYGNIGTQVSILSEAMGLKVLFYDTITKLPYGNATSVSSLKELLNHADIVSLHVPDLPTTRNLLNAETLTWCKKNALIINYARGEVIDLNALKTALEEKQIGGCAIDVYPNEPEKKGDPFFTPLQNLPNVLLTPHIGGSTHEAQENIGEDVSQKMLHYLEQGSTTSSLTVPNLHLPSLEGAHRILHIHNNVAGVMSAINTLLSKNKINILSQYLKTNEHIGYVVLDIDKKLSDKAFQLLKTVHETIKTRMLY